LPLESNKKINELIEKLSEDPNKLVSSFIRIINSTDNAYKKLDKKHKKLRAENKHLKSDKDNLVKLEKMASINQFSMGVAHEINNPISFIISNLNTLKNYQKILEGAKISIDKLKMSSNLSSIELKNLPFEGKDANQLKYILDDLPELINESLEGANRIKHIVKDLMSLKNTKEQLTQYANINDLIESCLKLTLRRIEHKVVINRSYGKIPEVKCYPNKLKQVFLNLILNAADAIEKRGTLTISTELIKNKILVVFADTGKGIKNMYLSKIFDPFFTTKEVGQGMGLGLSTAYSLIKLHNGEIEVEKNRDGKGTIFTILLPYGKHDIDSIHQKLLEV
jgi:signal transduction histidine kinase